MAHTSQEKNGMTHWLKKIWYIILILGAVLGAALGGARLWADQYYLRKDDAKVFVTEKVLALELKAINAKIDAIGIAVGAKMPN